MENTLEIVGNMENQDEIVLRIHWLSITVFVDIVTMGKFWDQYLKAELGILKEAGHGAPGFKKCMQGLAGAQIGYHPINNLSDGEFVSLQLPGQACDALEPDLIQRVIVDLNKLSKTNVTRLDVAFDNVPFTPDDFYNALCAGHVRSLAKRESIRRFSEPYALQEDGEKEGCVTVYFGSRSSMRSLRVYNKRGYPRLEVEYRKERANAVSSDVLICEPDCWPDFMVEHLLDFIDLVEEGSGERLVFWQEFINGRKRAGLKISDARITDLNKKLGWVGRQVSPTLALIKLKLGEEKIEKLIREGEGRMGKDLISLLEADLSKRDKGEAYEK
ncbi:MAG: replication initiation factor domain-containing protein [Chloroflexota bacterium]|nr:replication initiation factor domain-containing protein [Chloroflexota bacterium]